MQQPGQITELSFLPERMLVLLESLRKPVHLNPPVGFDVQTWKQALAREQCPAIMEDDPGTQWSRFNAAGHTAELSAHINPNNKTLYRATVVSYP
jgi:hypothetical protein